MLKRILIVVGILIVGIVTLIMLNNPVEVDTAVANIEEKNLHLLKKKN